ncbi:MAG: KdsC family phosphatase [Pyrinomonadaceae bacterium]
MDSYNRDWSLIKPASLVELLLMDCDGVLTDGNLYYGESGEALKTFSVYDGFGIEMWHRAGFKSGIITGRKSEILAVRAKELKVNYLFQDQKDKLRIVNKIAEENKLVLSQVAYAGDDYLDEETLQAVGFPIIVPNARIASQMQNAFYPINKGGKGAIRESIEFILSAKERNDR